MTAFKNLFSIGSTDYARFRPTYPGELFTFLATLTPGHTRAWDCGTGNGQAACALAEHFREVVATDPSQAQLTAATPHHRVRYLLAPAEKAPLEDHSVQIVTVAQAYHWFSHEVFHREVRRVLTPRGVLAVWSYGVMQVDDTTDQVIGEYYEQIVGPYWEPERRHVEAGYSSIPFPFESVTAPPFLLKAQWSFEQVWGYLGTWSATQTATKALGKDPRGEISGRLQDSWGDGVRLVTWPLTLRVGKA